MKIIIVAVQDRPGNCEFVLAINCFTAACSIYEFLVVVQSEKESR